MDRNLNDVHVFTKVVEAGSFTGAGRVLQVPTSSVSRRVARLERDLGVRLLQRTTRKLSLTDAGHLYYERGVRVFAELEEVESVLSLAQSTPRGRVRMVAPPEHRVATRLVNSFLKECPQVRIDVDFTSRDLNIIEEGYDLSIHAGPVTNLSVVAHKLMDSPFSLVASPAYLQRMGAPKAVSELSKHECVVFGPSSIGAHWTLTGASGVPVKVPVRGRTAANHLLAVRDSAIAGLGIALLPTMACSSEIHDGALRVILPQGCPPPVPLHVTYPAGRFLPAAVRAFKDFVRAHFKQFAEELPERGLHQASAKPRKKRARKRSTKKR